VIYVPNFTFNLISVSKITSYLDCRLIFSSNKCDIQDNVTNEKIGTVKATDGLYILESAVFCNSSFKYVASSYSTTDKNNNLWHNRMSHISDERLSILRSQFPFIANKTHVCDTCHRVKQKKLPFNLSSSHTSRYFELLHMDIWASCYASSMYGHKYFLTIVDDFSHFTCLIPMVTKSETRIHIENFIAYVKNQFENNVKIICTNGAEFAIKTFFSSKGIIHQTTCVEMPEQKGIVERKHKHILNVTRALIFQANLRPLFWNFAALHVVLLINCTPNPLLDNKSPYEKLYTKSYNLTVLRVFRCLCYSSIITAKRKKFDVCVVSGVFLGFQPHTNGYIFLNLKNHKIEVSMHVIFHEHQFPYKLNVDSNERPNILSPLIPQKYAFANDLIYDNPPNNTAHNTGENLMTGNTDYVDNNTIHI